MAHSYTYHDEKKYDASIIDEAMANIEKKMISERGEKNVYDLESNNCQTYINEVIIEAERIAKETGRQLIVS
jgi:histone H3/H4